MKKKSHSDDNGNGSGADNDDDEEISTLDYKKFLKKIFPSKHLDKTIEDLEEKMAKGEEEDEDEDDDDYIPYNDCSATQLKGELKSRGIKYNGPKDKKKMIRILEKDDEKRGQGEEEEEEEDEYETVEEEDSEDEEDSEEEEDEDDEDYDQSAGQFNIVLI